MKILYVEDELFLGKIVKESLESRGYEVHMESDGDKAIAAFKKVQPNICVLDVMLPGKDGFAIATAIRQTDKQVPILFLTAKTQTEDVVKGFTLGGNDYIRKPFSMEELIVRVENLLTLKGGKSTGTGSNPDMITMGAYTFHIPRQILQSPIEEKKLSYRESELLKYLFDHRNGIADRREILLELWGNDSFFNSRNLDVYITRLRSYLKDDPKLEILTIKGIGYRFVVE
jgi:DNA-binding response OmpR family regulator